MRKEYVKSEYSSCFRFYFDNPRFDEYIGVGGCRTSLEKFSDWKHVYTIEIVVPKDMINEDGSFNEEFTAYIEQEALYKWRCRLLQDAIGAIKKYPIEFIHDVIGIDTKYL